MEAVRSRRNRRLSRWAGSVLAALVLAVLGGLSVAAPASAHAALTASDPAEGATISADRQRVSLTFSEAPLAGLDAGLRIEVRDADGADESTGDVVISGTTMSKAVRLTAGPHTVLWRYVSPDGHPIDGQVSFTVTAAVPSSTASSTASPAPSSATPAPSPSSASAPSSEAAASMVPSGPFPWVLGGIVVVLLGAGTAALIARRCRRA